MTVEPNVIRRIGILGGTFDPVHIGHLVLAVSAREQLSADELLVIPNVRSPLKSVAPHASFADRLAMLDLALNETTGISTSDIEGRRGGVSFMVDTLRALRERCDPCELILVLGADALEELPSWREAKEVRRLARLAVVSREGAAIPRTAPDLMPVVMPRIDISASLIRQRISAGSSIDFLTPFPVVSYIHKKGLYRTP